MRCSYLVLAAVGTAALALIGCTDDVDGDFDALAPARPRGVTSISGDEQVTIVWFANEEHDLDGYEVWRSRDDDSEYQKIATLRASATRYTDHNVVNGQTYYYALLAFDDDGNESELSPEDVKDTPRPEGTDVTLDAFDLDAASAGFTFAEASIGPRHWDADDDGLLDPDVDLYFGVDLEFNIRYLYSDHEDMFMQDLGYHGSMDEVDMAPDRGFTTFSTEVIDGHVYAFYTPREHYAKMHVTRVTNDFVTFDWAYQLQQDNPDLAPSKFPAQVVRGAWRP